MRVILNWLGAFALFALISSAVAPQSASAMTIAPALGGGPKAASAIIPARVIMGHGFHSFGGGGGGHYYGGAGRYYGGGHYYGGPRYYGHRWGPRYYGGSSFYFGPGYYYGSYPRRCRVVWTYYGPRRICRLYRPWYW